MKKLNKKILLATLGIASFAIVTPGILTSCSTTNTNDPNNPGGGDNTGGDNTGGDQTKAIVPEIKASYEKIGSILDLFDESGNYTKFDQMLKTEFTNDPSKIISNYDKFSAEQKKDLTINVQTPENKTWGGTNDFTTWNTAGTQTVYYSSQSQQINVGNTAELKTYLSNADTLKQIMTDAGRTDAATKTYELVTESQLSADANRDYLNINVKEKSTVTATSSSATDVNLNLILPVSDLNLVLKNATVEVSHKDSKLVQTVKQTTQLTYNIGIDNTVVLPENFTSNNNNIIVNNQDVTNETVINALGLGTIDKLNSDVIGQSTQIFNTTFSDLNVDVANSSMTLNATPNQGYSWTDGTSTSKSITTDQLKFVNYDFTQKYNPINGQASVETFVNWLKIVQPSNNQTVYYAVWNLIKSQIINNPRNPGFSGISNLVYEGSETAVTGVLDSNYNWANIVSIGTNNKPYIRYKGVVNNAASRATTTASTPTYKDIVVYLYGVSFTS